MVNIPVRLQVLTVELLPRRQVRAPPTLMGSICPTPVTLTPLLTASHHTHSPHTSNRFFKNREMNITTVRRRPEFEGSNAMTMS